MTAKRSEVYWVDLEPAIGSATRKARPCVVVSPDELNACLRRVIVAPLTSTIRPFRFRVTTTIAKRPASVVLDQLRTVDLGRLGKRVGKVDERAMRDVLEKLHAMFAV